MIDLQADIKENDLLALSPELLSILLKDHTLSTDAKQVNIFWATDNYAHKETGYQYNDQITIEAIIGENGNVIVPRSLKSREQQKKRSRNMAEIFTPSWVCNKQNNLVDECKFERKNVFNTEIDDADTIKEMGLPGNGLHSWIVNPEPIAFPKGMTWWDYVKDNVLEITCGEAPYLASRYDTVTGEPIALERRIGILDRKLRVVNENTTTYDEWMKGAMQAFKSTYGYEWQGDNLVLARKSLLYTFIDYYRARFGADPQLKDLLYVANIVSWNIWQMDGLKGVIPNSCKRTPIPQYTGNLIEFGNGEQPLTQKFSECPGCKNKNIHAHNGIRCLIMDWEEGKPIEFISLMKHT